MIRERGETGFLRQRVFTIQIGLLYFNRDYYNKHSILGKNRLRNCIDKIVILCD